MSEYKNIEFQIKQYQMLEAKGELTEYAQGKLNGMLEVMNIAKNNEVLGDVIEPTTIERNMLVWFNDDIHEVEFIIDDRIEVKELRSGTVFVATKEELTPVR